VGLVNVMMLEGMGKLGAEQIAWLEDDLKGRSASTPVVLFAHIPLWTVYPDWGWGTQDSAQALSYLKRFGSVTVLNGHIHQVMQKVEGNVTFHTAMSTAFPQPAPGAAPAPGPMKVPDDKLRGVFGISDVQFVRRNHSLAVVNSSLAGEMVNPALIPRSTGGSANNRAPGMTTSELNEYQNALEAKQAELVRIIRNRDGIAIEKYPDAIDENDERISAPDGWRQCLTRHSVSCASKSPTTASTVAPATSTNC